MAVIAHAGPLHAELSVPQQPLPSEASCSIPGTQHEALPARGTPIAELSGLLEALAGGAGDVVEQRDPIEPFTLYGTSIKKYLIEVLDGEKVVARKRGFTVDACVGALPVSEEAQFQQGLPTSEKAFNAYGRTCSKAESPDLKVACTTSCQGACQGTIEAYAAGLERRTGLRLLPGDIERLLRSCARNCGYECSKPGKQFSFELPFRKGP